MASNVELQGTKLKLELDWAINKGRDVRGERDYFELWNSSGAIAFCSPALQEIHLPPFGNSLNDAPQFRWLSLGKGIEGRALGVTFQPDRNDESDEETESAAAAPAQRNTPICRQSQRQRRIRHLPSFSSAMSHR